MQLANRNDSVHKFLATRGTFLQRISNNEPDQALKLELTRTLDRSASSINLLSAEALRLEGIALMMLEKFDQAIDRYNEAFGLLQANHSWQASQIGLLLGESHRHAKHHEQWKQSWVASVEIQSRWLQERGLMNPAFWKKAAFLRPVSSSWPERTIARMENELRKQNLDFGLDESRGR